MDRTNENNPTGKPFCCKIGCENDATWQIWYGKTTDDFTESCNDHIGELASDVNEFNAQKL